MVQYTLEEAYYNNIVKGINKQLTATISWLGTKEAQRFFNRRSQNIHTFWKQSQMKHEWDNITRSNAKNSREYVEQIYRAGAKHGYMELNRVVGYTLADRETLYHLKEYNYRLIKGLNQNLIRDIKTTLTQAEAEGLHPFETAYKIRDLGLEPINNLSSLQRARMIARTESRRATTSGTLQAYKNYGINEGIVITQENPCPECEDNAANNPHKLEDLTDLVPQHPNCMCVVGAYLEDNTTIELDKDSDPIISEKIT